MEQRSLELAGKRIIETISTIDAPLEDRVELMMNLIKILNNYKETMDILEKHRILKKEI